MRTNTWLAERLQTIHASYFLDVPISNAVLVRFGRSCKNRFGSIIMRPMRGYSDPVSLITINSLFRTEEVPEYVIEATLAHELAHYCHGFHSPLPQLYKYPHQGGIVTKELGKRGAGNLLKQQNKWIKTEYREFLRRNHAP